MSGMTRCWRRWGWLLGLGSWLAMVGAMASSFDCAQAQITPDGTLPNNSTVTNQGNTSLIEGGTQAGGNLFHSFKEFSVPTGGTAFFNNAADIQNIISRVTGGSVSNIDGLIRASGTANLFLINPNGIMFGPNASLNVGGSFLASTASSLKFADAREFSATAPQATLLTISVPVGLQYGANPGSIMNQSQTHNSSDVPVGLQVQPGKTLALVGGNVSLDNGSLQAPNGRVELGGLAEKGTVGLNFTGNNLSLSFPQGVQRASVSLTNAAKVDVTDRGAGSVSVTARNLDILGGSKIDAGIGQGLTAVGSPPGDITLNATGVVTINQQSRVTNVVADGATGNAGNINIISGEIFINNLASAPALDSSSSGQGRAGNVSLLALGSINIIGQDVNASDKVISSRSSRSEGLSAGNISLKANGSISLSKAYLDAISRSERGDAGNISLHGLESVSLANNSSLVTTSYGTGNSGSITVQSSGPISFQNSLVATNVYNRVGNAGNINISGRSVSFNTGTEVTARSFEGVNSGNIEVNATDKVEIKDNDPLQRSDSDRSESFSNSTLTTRTEEKATGNAGNINIKAGEIFINNQASTPALDSSSSGQGRAGNVSLLATGSISLIGIDVNKSHKVISSRSASEGLEAGNISLRANGSISLSKAYLDAISRSERGAGSISLHGQESVSLANNSSLVTTNSGTGNSGNITVQSNGPVSIEHSLVATNIDPDANFFRTSGIGGNIYINGRSVSVIAGSEVSARALGGGNPGNIQVNATDKVEISGSEPQDLPDERDRSQTIIYSALLTTSEEKARGAGGDISVNTGTLRVSDGAGIRAESRSDFSGGDIRVNANVVDLTGGGQLLTSAFSGGDAGNIYFNVTDRISISGSNPSKAELFNQIAETYGESEAKFKLGSASPDSGIFASTESSNGGNITIDVQNLLLLRQNGQISAQAGSNGNGGNITINAPDGFIVAVPKENSDIIANAFIGNGGKINITTAGIYGLENRSQQPRNPTISEINASSDFGLDGTVEINTLNVDPNSGLVDLPAVPVDTKVAQGCYAGGTQAQSEFIITGRGGLPPNPGEALTTDAVLVNLVTLNPEVDGRTTKVSTSRTSSAPPQIVEATGWVVDKDGNVVLTANAPTTPHSSWQTPTKCNAPKSSS